MYRTVSKREGDFRSTPESVRLCSDEFSPLGAESAIAIDSDGFVNLDRDAKPNLNIIRSGVVGTVFAEIVVEAGTEGDPWSKGDGVLEDRDFGIDAGLQEAGSDLGNSLSIGYVGAEVEKIANRRSEGDARWQIEGVTRLEVDLVGVERAGLNVVVCVADTQRKVSYGSSVAHVGVQFPVSGTVEPEGKPRAKRKEVVLGKVECDRKIGPIETGAVIRSVAEHIYPVIHVKAVPTGAEFRVPKPVSLLGNLGLIGFAFFRSNIDGGGHG